ncbi:MAG: adenylate/guanylate cyclase domain-containing protein, partial [Hyphomicrobiales bacterium]
MNRRREDIAAPKTLERTPPGLSSRLARAFAHDQSQALMLAAKVRGLAILPIVIWLSFQTMPNAAAYWWQITTAGIFLPLSLLHYFAARHGGQRFLAVYALFAVDTMVMGLFFATANPFVDVSVPAATAFALAPFFWFLFFLIHAAFSANWRLVVWTGGSIMVVRALQVVWIANRPGTKTDIEFPILSVQDRLAAAMDPNFLIVYDRIGDLIGVASFTIATAFLVWRSHQILERQVLAERARAQISRYVSTAVVDEVMAQGGRFIVPREADVGVLFVDVVGFTAMAEKFSPEQSINFLRQLHGRLAEAIFSHNGAIDKFLGDGLMATFGGSVPSSAKNAHAAVNALAAGIDMVSAIDDWNTERAASHEPRVDIGVGVDFGPAIIGDVGDNRRLEFTVVGDTVNVAARVEALTRSSETSML